ncbi:Fic family protein [Aquimarina sediminis]|uniref:Fic family protein n=1 Tax=Aquimarina sediminis TaxID=2070536 RepID=UPI000CA0176C|nr:Fic family protein [Aquimarina sediminis]
MDTVVKLSKELPFLKEVDVLKEEIDKHRPLPNELKDKIFQKLRLDWNYNSNAIEGNSFTYGETIALLMEGITAKGKPLKDALDIKGHNEAIDFMMDMVASKRDLNETDIRSLHKLVLGKDYHNDAVTKDGLKTKKLIQSGIYKTSPNHVQTATGEIHYYATPEETPIKMKELVDWYNTSAGNQDIHPLVLASVFHHRFVAIHPFDDGNGRMTRILTNFILLKFGYPVSVIRQETKNEYYACLSQADNGQIIPIVEYISESVKSSLKIYQKGIYGEDISEPDDIDKEIALFRKELGVKNGKKNRDPDDVIEISFKIFSFLKKKLEKFEDLFVDPVNSGVQFLESFSEEEYKQFNFLNFEEYKKYLIDKDLFAITGVYTYYESEIYINLDVKFNYGHYKISFKEFSCIKYYDEKVIDDNYLKIVKEIINYVIQEIKNK